MPTPQASPPAADERPARPARLRLPPERRTRIDVVVGVALVVLVLAAAVVVGLTSDAANTRATPAAAPIAAPPAAGAVPAAFTEAWHAASGATPAPVLAGPAVVTGDGSTVTGRDALTGAPAWTYVRDVPLCTVGSGFDGLSGDSVRALALYAGHTGWCSELTALRPDTGTRAGARNPDLRPGTRLLSNGTVVAGTGARTIEVMRFDLVRTTEYGLVETPVQPGAQPRPQCIHSSTAIGPDRVGVIEQCPGEPTDRVTVLQTDESSDDAPAVVFSTLLPTGSATVVAVSAHRTAVALPDPPRLVLLDDKGVQVAQSPLAATPANLAAAATAPGGAPDVSVLQGAQQGAVSWWTGSSTVVLTAGDLRPVTTVPDTLGPAVDYGDTVLVPVSGGLAVLDANGRMTHVIPVLRPDPGAPVHLAVQGEVLLEQRGNQVAGLVPG